jgi:hypothetical protein
LSNYKIIDFFYSNPQSSTVESSYNETRLFGFDDLGYGFRNLSVNFQTTHIKGCSDWVFYFSAMSEVWSFFLIFYFLALFFFFFYILPGASASVRLSTNFSTSKSWLSSTLSCGVPFILIFSVLYESIFMLFTNEVFPSRISPLFLIEGKQWKWEYRFNLVGILEFSQSSKVVGESSLVKGANTGRMSSKVINSKISKILGSDLFETALRVKSELLKSKKTTLNTMDLVTILNLDSKAPFRSELTSSFNEFFTRFRSGETTRRMVTATKSVFIPDTPLTKAHITGCDVIHSWTVPSLGIRIDAVPGKMYSVKIPFLYYGVFVGQCSEVCGLRHAYMPISISFLPWSSFSKIIYVQLFSSVDLWFSKYSLNRKSAY